MRRLLANLWRLLTAPFRFAGGLIGRVFAKPVRFFTEEPEDTPLGETVQKAIAHPSDVLAHLAALRGHLLRATLALIIVSFLMFEFSGTLMAWLAAPIGGLQGLQAIDVTEPIGVVMRVTMLSAFAITLPYIAFELLLFVAPGLSRRARLVGFLAIPLVFLLFVGGMAFTYYYLLPPAVTFLLNFMEIPTMVRPSSYIGFATGLMFWVGLAFEFPLLSYVLAAMGLLPARWLGQNWRIAVVVLAVLAAAITPTIDPINMMLVWLPLIFLYFVSVATASLAQRSRAKRRAAQ
ncbi:MAG TPA: twin-arginine translocase subunit TatC [Anaerolineales bacterium]|nr:twin-arginine translocase subunit TatC [Anaerolineales bacterium]